MLVITTNFWVLLLAVQGTILIANRGNSFKGVAPYSPTSRHGSVVSFPALEPGTPPALGTSPFQGIALLQDAPPPPRGPSRFAGNSSSQVQDLITNPVLGANLHVLVQPADVQMTVLNEELGEISAMPE